MSFDGWLKKKSVKILADFFVFSTFELQSCFKIFPFMKIYIPAFVHKYRFYVLTTIGLLVWVIFFDGSNLIAQVRLWQKLNDLENQQEYYVSELKKVKEEEQEVMGNHKSMEKFAREKYLMKKTGETVFVIVDEDNQTIEKVEE